MEIRELWNKINSKYYLSLIKSLMMNVRATLDILMRVSGQIIATSIEQRLALRWRSRYKEVLLTII